MFEDMTNCVVSCNALSGQYSVGIVNQVALMFNPGHPKNSI